MLNEPQLDGIITRDAHVTPTNPSRIELHYSRSDVPSSYQCSCCGATRCKLWKDHSGRLFCAHDAAEREQVDISGLESRIGGYENIGAMYPAVPQATNEKVTWYQHEIPGDGMCWWRNLATLPI